MVSPYNLDDVNIPPGIQRRLDAKLMLNKKQRSDLFGAIVADVFQYTKYPTTNQYTEMMTAILSTWPHLTGGEIEGTAWTSQDASVSIWLLRNSPY